MSDLTNVPTDLHENLAWRRRLLQAAESDPKVAAAVKYLFQRDILFAFKTLFWTYDPRPEAPHPNLPFIPYPFQEQLIKLLCKHIEEGGDLVVFKSRDMGVTWVATTVILWYWLRSQPGYDFLIGSRKEELVDKRGSVDTLFGKVRYNLYMLPEWLRPAGFKPTKHDQHMLLVNQISENQAITIKGEANNENFGTGGRYRAVLVDEFAKWKSTDFAAWTSLGDATRCRIAVSSAFGRNNCFAELVTKPPRGVHIVKLPWTLHPLKDKAWYEAERQRRTEVEMAQEIDMNLDASAGARFFREFNQTTHLVEADPILGSEVLVGFDFGYRHPCMLATQIDSYDRWIWQRVILGRDVEIGTFAEYCLKRLQEWFPGADFRFYVDVAGAQRSDKSAKTSIQILREVLGPRIPVIYRKVDREDIAATIRKMLNTNIEGRPSLLVAKYEPNYPLPHFVEREDTAYLVEGFTGGIHYPDRPTKEDWAKEGYYEHGFDAAGFIVASAFGYNASISERRQDIEKLSNVIAFKRPRRGYARNARSAQRGPSYLRRSPRL